MLLLELQYQFHVQLEFQFHDARLKLLDLPDHYQLQVHRYKQNKKNIVVKLYFIQCITL